jgi:hypothetical protein
MQTGAMETLESRLVSQQYGKEVQQVGKDAEPSNSRIQMYCYISNYS